MGWQVIGLLALGLVIVLCGVISAGYEIKQHRRSLRKFDARVGRDCYRDIRGVTK
jgi:hypothetical protein